MLPVTVQTQRRRRPLLWLRHPVQRAGTSLVEVVVSVLLTSMVIVGALNGMAIVHRKDSSADIHTQLRYRADLLLEEITRLAYEDPESSPSSPFLLGLDDEETSTDRTTWDDIDDAHNWRSDPLKDRDGSTKLALSYHLKANVTVQWVDPFTLRTSSSETGLKEIKVVVTSNDLPGASGTAVGYLSRNSYRAQQDSGVEITVTTESGEELQFFANPVNGASLPEDFSL